MIETFPKKIFFLSDDTECELIEEIIDKKIKDRYASFVFTKGYYLLNSKVSLGLIQLDKLLKNKRIEIL